MTEINIPMNDWSKGRLAANSKYATSRSKKYGRKGDTFTVYIITGTALRYEILDVVKLPLWMIFKFLYVAEGAESPEELMQVWKNIHPSFDREKDKDKEYWVHFFKQIWGL